MKNKVFLSIVITVLCAFSCTAMEKDSGKKKLRPFEETHFSVNDRPDTKGRKILASACSPGMQYLAIALNDGALKIYDLQGILDGKKPSTCLLGKLSKRFSDLKAFAFSYDINDKPFYVSLSFYRNEALLCDFGHSHREISLSSGKETLTQRHVLPAKPDIWPTLSKLKKRLENLPKKDDIYASAISPDTHVIAVNSYDDKTLTLWRLNTNSTNIRNRKYIYDNEILDLKLRTYALALSPDSRYLAAIAQLKKGAKLIVWDTKKLKNKNSIDLPLDVTGEERFWVKETGSYLILEPRMYTALHFDSEQSNYLIGIIGDNVIVWELIE
jgi:WD40 repeat protein